MIHSEVLKNYFEIYSESELVYRRYHEILADQAHFPERLQALRQEIIEKAGGLLVAGGQSNAESGGGAGSVVSV